MLYGPVAAGRRFRKRVLAGAPVFGEAMIDFVNGTYTVNGESLTAADVVSDTDRISGDGLSILPGYENVLNFLGAFQDLLFVRNWSIVMELDLLAPEDSEFLQENMLFWLANADETRYIRFSTMEAWPRFLEWDGTTERDVLIETSHDVGINRIALTRTSDLASMSMNGATAVTDAQSITDIGYSVSETAWHSKTLPAGFIRSIEILSPVGPASLPALSAL